MADSGAIPERLLPLAGGCNFRDLGGYVTADGARLRWRQVFRSGVMTHLQPADVVALERLGIACVVDLRRADERQREPTRWVGTGVRLLSHDDPVDAGTLGRLIEGRSLDANGARAAMIELYRLMPQWLLPRLKLIFQTLAASPAPLLFNCAAGKDRTGFAAAVLLECLGVSRETVLADYLLTNEVARLDAFLSRHQDGQMGVGNAAHPLLALPEAVRLPLLAADADYLDAALTGVASAYGSSQRFVRDALGLGSEGLVALRRHLLDR